MALCTRAVTRSMHGRGGKAHVVARLEFPRGRGISGHMCPRQVRIGYFAAGGKGQSRITLAVCNGPTMHLPRSC